MSIVRYHRHGPRHHKVSRQEMWQLLDRFFDQGAPRHGTRDADDSAIATAQWQPRVDIKEEPGRFVIHADLPGVDPQDIEVQMDKGILSIKGVRMSDAGEHEAGGSGTIYSRVERRHGTFHRRFALPDSADADAVSAQGRHGVLEVVIPKKPETTPRRVQVGVAAQAAEPTVQ